MKQRYPKIDILRGLSIIIMIFLHTSAYLLTTKTVNIIYNYLHMAVPLFVFCSGFVLFRRYHNVSTLREAIEFIKKRIIRLLKPYYIFLLFFFVIVFFHHHALGIKDILGGVFLYGEPDINWLVVLFLELTLLFPFALFLKRYKYGLEGLLFLSGVASIALILFHLPFDYRLYMWISWLLPYLLAAYYDKLEKWRNVRLILPVLFFLSFLIQTFSMGQGLSINLHSHKYPPDFMYLSYGLGWLFLLDLLFDIKWFQKGWFYNIMHFFSVNSYMLFFVHYLVIHFIYRLIIYKIIDKPPFNAYGFFIVVLIFSVIITKGLNYFFSILKKAN